MLVAAAEPAGPTLPLGERVRRLFADDGKAQAVFAPDGPLLHANAAALQCLRGTTTLSALGIEALAAKALETGHASGAARLGETAEVAAERLGKDDSRVFVLTLPPQPGAHPPRKTTRPYGRPRHSRRPSAAQAAYPAPPATEPAVSAQR